jgi:hypothetical protein
MSYGISDPVTGELAENKANRGGDNLTNPATWRGALDVPETAAVYLRGDANTRLNALAPRQGVEFVQPATGTAPIAATLAQVLSGTASSVIVKFRFRSVAAGRDNTILTQHNSIAVDGRLSLRRTSTGLLQLFKGGGTPNSITSTGTLSVGDWHEVAFTDDGGECKLYLNGVEVANGTLISGYSAQPFRLAAVSLSATHADSAPSDITIDRVAAFNFALPATTTSGVVGVAERYASGVWVQPLDRPLNAVVRKYTTTANVARFTPSGASLAIADAGARTGLVEVTSNVLVSGSNASFRWLDSPALNIANSHISVSFEVYDPDGYTSAGNVILAEGFGYGVTPTRTDLGGGWLRYSFVRAVRSASPGGGVLSQLRTYLENGTPIGGKIWIDPTTYSFEVFGSTLDLIPIGVGRVLIDRSASRNHAIVSGTVHPTYLQPAESGRIIATTNTNGNQQLLGASLTAFDAANKYRITSWTVTSTGTPEIDLGNVSTGTQYVDGLVLVANKPTAITLATSIAETANLWCHSTTTDPITHVITYERIS